jgi:putative polyketide hydroxylase
VRNCICAQDDLEPVSAATRQRSATARSPSDTSWRASEQDAAAVTATLRAGGGDHRVRARYVIAADGARSRVREPLGIGCTARPALYRSINVPAQRRTSRPWTRTGRPRCYFIEQPGPKATFPHDQRRQIAGASLVNKLRRRLHDEYTPERCAASCGRRPGVPDLCRRDPGRGAVGWRRARRRALSPAVACFLAGDAAPPHAAYRRLRPQHGRAGRPQSRVEACRRAAGTRGCPALLDTYEDERLPYGAAITEQSLINARSLGPRRPRADRPAAAAALATDRSTSTSSG